MITTVAGDGTRGFSGDGGPATNASLSDPSGVAVDTAGNLYIADTSNHRVRKVSVSGTITTIAGNGSSGSSTNKDSLKRSDASRWIEGVCANSVVNDLANSAVNERDGGARVRAAIGDGRGLRG
jgi:hypothetical protein